MQLISEEGPVYPAEAKSQGVEGYVVVRYDISLEGTVSSVRVVESMPDGVFDESAIQAIQQWRYLAPILDGQAQAVSGVTSRITFRLGDDSAYSDL
jgi:protein TonB